MLQIHMTKFLFLAFFCYDKFLFFGRDKFLFFGHGKLFASQCLEICQTLAGKSLPFAFCINIGSNFSFSVDTRGKEVEVLANPKRKKKTPSTLRRDARRREDFLNKKLNAPTAE